MKTIGIFSGSRWPTLGRETLEKSLLVLTNAINVNNFKIAYGGGESGLMGVIPKRFHENGGQVIGIDAKMFADKYGTASFGTQLVYETFHERQHKLIEEADIILALPGGVGTIYEIMEVITFNDLNLWGDEKNYPIKKEIICYNFDGYFDSLKLQLKYGVENGLISENSFKLVKWCQNVEQIQECILEN